MTSEWAFIGLFYDVVGVVILAIGVIAHGNAALFEDEALVWTGPRKFRMRRVHRVDTFFGLTFLGLGFVCQAVGAIGNEFIENGMHYSYGTFLTILVNWGGWRIWVYKYSDRLFDDIKANRQKE